MVGSKPQRSWAETHVTLSLLLEFASCWLILFQLPTVFHFICMAGIPTCSYLYVTHMNVHAHTPHTTHTHTHSHTHTRLMSHVYILFPPYDTILFPPYFIYPVNCYVVCYNLKKKNTLSLVKLAYITSFTTIFAMFKFRFILFMFGPTLYMYMCK